jgi:hypothetical protein
MLSDHQVLGSCLGLFWGGVLRVKPSNVESGLSLACVKRAEASASYPRALSAPGFLTASRSYQIRSITTNKNAPMELPTRRNERIPATVQLPGGLLVPFGVRQGPRFTGFPRTVDKFDSRRPTFAKSNVPIGA